MMKDLALACLSFSAYLTLKRWLLSSYLVLVATGSATGFYQLLFSSDFPLLSGGDETQSQAKLLAYLMSQIFYTVFTVVGTILYLRMLRQLGDSRQD